MSETTPRTQDESEPRPVPGPTDEQVDSRADSLEAEPGNQPADAERQARALLEESEARIEDPAARVPGDPRVIRRGSDEGLGPDEGGAPAG
jgi:hypothetical protein